MEINNYKTKNNKGIIPKQIFFFWDNEKMSWMRYMTLKSFRTVNPDWKIILFWTNSQINEKKWKDSSKQDFFDYYGEDCAEGIKELNIDMRYVNFSEIFKNKIFENMSAVQKSDFFRWYMLYTEGGFYSDMDIIYFRPLDDLYNNSISNGYDTVICETSHLSIGFLASAKNNDYYKDIFLNCFKNYDPSKYESAGILCIYNLLNSHSETFELAKKKYENLKIYNLPFNIVYPLHYSKIAYAFSTDIKINDLPKESIGYHTNDIQ